MNPTTEKEIRIVIVGATGMVGGYALHYALDHPAVKSVTVIGRREIGISHSKLTQILHQDFSNCSALSHKLSGQNACVFCLGAYTGAVPDAELRRATVDYTVEFARVLHAASPNAVFSFLSGSGADPTGRSRMAFARYKGQAETALIAAGFRVRNRNTRNRFQPRQDHRLSTRTRLLAHHSFPGCIAGKDVRYAGQHSIDRP